MIADGLFERFPVEAVFGLHNHPGLPLGEFGVLSGPVMAAYDEFTIVVRGRGGHAAMPHQTDDVVLAASHLVVAAQSIVSRVVDPMQNAVLSFTTFRAGEARNVLASTATLEGSFRSFRPEERRLIAERLRDLAGGVAAAFAVDARVEIHPLYPPTVNHPRETEIVRSVVSRRFGDRALAVVTPQPASEDFAFMLERVPGTYVLLGAGDPAHVHPVHHPRYDFNDAATPYGAEFWRALAHAYFQEPARPGAVADV